MEAYYMEVHLQKLLHKKIFITYMALNVKLQGMTMGALKCILKFPKWHRQ